MLALILAHGDEVCLIQKNVGSHQHRVSKEACGNVVSMLGSLGLELGHAAQLTKLGIAVEDPAQLCVLRHMALDEHDVLLRIEAAGDILCQLIHAALTHQRGILTDSDGVHVHDAIQAIILILQGYPVFDSAHIRTQRQLTGGLNTAENTLFSILLHNTKPHFISDLASQYSFLAILSSSDRKSNGKGLQISG